jgi:hypothetical protein
LVGAREKICVLCGIVPAAEAQLMGNPSPFKHMQTVDISTLTTIKLFLFYYWLWLMPITNFSSLMMILTENSDDGIFAHLNMARHLEDIAGKPLSGTNKSLPLIIVRDEAFPLPTYAPISCFAT